MKTNLLSDRTLFKRVVRTVLLLFLIWSVPVAVLAGQITVTGTVTDADGLPIVGAAVTVVGATGGTTTDSKGNYVISVPSAKSELRYSFLGFQEQTIVVGSRAVIDVVLTEDATDIEGVVVVGYGTQKRTTVTGAISEIKTDEIMKSPTGTLSTSVAGRIPGLLVKQDKGQPGDDKSTIKIRGISTFGDNSTDPLVLVDGIERDFNSIDPEEVESFTVLKDAASTAVYGVRGANGVILVTTKRGVMGPARVSYSGNVALQMPTRLPKVAGSYDYARFYNQALKNDSPGIEVGDYYKPEELAKYRDHTDPIFYPDTDWMSEVFNKVALQHKHNLNVTGGTRFARYYVSLGYFDQGGLQKNVSQSWGYNNQDRYQRINLRSNVDMSITATTTLAVTLGVSNGHKVRTPGGSLFSQTFVAPPNSSPGRLDGKFVTLDGRPDRNPLYALTQGIQDYYENHLDVNVELSQRLDFITEGLSVKGKVAYDDNYTQSSQRNKTEQRFVIRREIVDGEETILFNPIGEVGELGAPGNYFDDRSKRVYTEVSLNYNRTFGQNHNVAALLLMNSQKTKYKYTSETDFPGIATGYIEYVGRISYNYAEKYLVEFNMGINGSEFFAPGKRYGYFPAVSAGWVVTNEKFMQNLISPAILSYLKFRVSYGEVGNDRSGLRRFYYYPQTYVDGSGFNYGESPQWRPGYKQGAQTNPDVSWEKAVKQNYAVEARFFKDKLFVNFDYFLENRRDILATPDDQPFLAGFSPAIYNLGKTKNKGFELEIGWNQTIRNFSWYIQGNYSFARNKIIYMAEAKDPDNPNLWKTGRRVGEKFGYVFDGFFDSYEEINNSPTQFGVTLYPGDVKYKDVNGDGVVDTNDQVPLQHPAFPEINYGISAGFSYKGFDLSVLFQGAANTTLNIGGNFQKPFDQNGGPIMEHSFDAWSPTNKEGAKYPRLSVSHSQAQNYYSSDIWIKDASYLRFKNAEMGYTFNLKHKIRFMSSVRVYVSAQNIFVWDKLDGIVDPENKTDNNGINYPQQRVMNLGVNIKF